MRSSWLLFKIFRRRLWICLFIEMVVIFLMVFFGDSLQRQRSMGGFVAISMVLAALLSLWACFPARFNTLPFPVSIRQRAWLPLAMFTTILAGSGVALFVALLCRGFGLFRLPDFFFSALSFLPLYLFVYLFVYRFLRTKPHFIGFCGMAGAAPQMSDSEWLKALMGTYHLWWPALLLGIAFYIYEAPIVLARRDRLMVGQQNPNFRFFALPDLMAAWRSHLATWIADTFESAALLAALIIFALYFLPNLVPGFLQGYGSIAIFLASLFFATIVLSIFKNQYLLTAASGFSPVSALGMTLMEMTLVLNPLAQVLGVKKGIIARCDQCQKTKFLWATHCPHCGNPGSGMIANKKLNRFAQGKPIVPQWRVRLFLRLFIPLQFFFMFGLAGTFGSRPFITHSTLISFVGVEDPQARERAISRIEDLLAKHPDPAVWLLPKKASVGAAPRAPERFRLEVTPQHGSLVKISGFSLRWDTAQALPEVVAQRLAEEIEDIGKVNLVEVPKRGSRGATFRMRSYLDNQIHWVEPQE